MIVMFVFNKPYFYIAVEFVSYNFMLCRVCVKWRRVCADQSLWQAVDLSNYTIALQPLRKLMRTRFTETLRVIKLQGYFNKCKYY